MSIVNKHPDKMSPLGISLVANDGITTSGVAHRSLAENGHNDVLLNIGARPQCSQPNVNLRLVARRMISQRQREI